MNDYYIFVVLGFQCASIRSHLVCFFFCKASIRNNFSLLLLMSPTMIIDISIYSKEII